MTTPSPERLLDPDYEALKAFGHSAAKAAEIILDAKRDDPYSQRWISLVRAAALRSLAEEGEQ